MTQDEIKAEFDKIISEDGPWYGHYFKLPGDIETLPNQYSNWQRDRALFSLGCAQLALGKPASSIRALDLGCNEGGMSIALAQAGCEVVGIEARASSLRKAKFVAAALGVNGITFIQGDMLRIAELNLGKFDLICCAGTLYHVDAPDLLPFVASLNDACVGVTVFDTHIALEYAEKFTAIPNLDVFGKSILEHDPGEIESVKNSRLWASADNSHSFWMTERSLANLVMAAGFVQVTRPLAPIPEWGTQDRAYWLAYSSQHAANVAAVIPSVAKYLREPDMRTVIHNTMLSPANKLYDNPATEKIEPQQNVA